MRIAILGTRGIPNNYGGFEQFAEYLSRGLAGMGHELFVYSSHDHPYRQKTWNGVNLIHVLNPEKYTGTWGQFIYDLLCILDTRKRKLDIIMQLGYTSSSVWGKLLPKKAVIVTNMDGYEWKRTKYRPVVRKFLLYAEKLAVRTSDHLVADSKGIQAYLLKKYGIEPQYLPYGTDRFSGPDPGFLHAYGLKADCYSLLIARIESENNIETILDGIAASRLDQPFLVIGNTDNEFGKYLLAKFSAEKRIRFLGATYDLALLNNMRYHSHFYFHGHSVGGTNPSLLEAMAASALICAHDNEFNRAVLGNDAFYFRNSEDVSRLMDGGVQKETKLGFVNANLNKVETFYLWSKIVSDYEKYFLKVVAEKNR